MKKYIKIFIDETSHLEHDGHYNMCIGYIQVPADQYDVIKSDIRKLQLKYRSPFELKWNKFSKSRLPYYKALVDYFFESSLFFRCVLVKPKSRLDHLQFNQGSHDNYYYKIIYYLIKKRVRKYSCDIYLDIKDTISVQKIRKIKEILQSEFRTNEPFKRIQHLRSEDNIFIQLADFFIGAISYKGRSKKEGFSNPYKRELIKYIEIKSGFSLDDGTP